MDSFKIKGNERKVVGKKSSKKLRKEGMVPCVLYGGSEITHFYTELKNFINLIYTPNTYIVELEVDGKMRKAIVQDVQFDVVSDKVSHVDFVEVIDGKPVIINIPIHLIGNAKGIEEGGRLRQKRRYLKVKALAEDLPNYLEIDITDLDVSEYIHVRDLQFDKLELLDPPEAMIAGVVSSRVFAKGMIELEEADEAAAEEASAEGETAKAAEAEESTDEEKAE